MAEVALANAVPPRVSGADLESEDDERAGRHGDSRSEWLHALKSKDASARVLEQSLETEQRERRSERERFSAERLALCERHQQEKVELQRQLELRETECRELREDFQLQRVNLEMLLEASRQRELELIERHQELASDARRLHMLSEESNLELQAYRTRSETLAAEIVEVQNVLRTSDEVRLGLLREAQERSELIEQRNVELRELRLEERSGREKAQAQYDRLSAQCESLARQAQDKGREADILEERVKRLEEALKGKGIEVDHIRSEAEERRRELEGKLERCTEEAAALQKNLAARDGVESGLRERVAILEAQIEGHKSEEQKLRQDLFREQSAREERELEVTLGKRREQQLAETIASLEGQLGLERRTRDEHQTSLFSVRAHLQTAELELQGAKESVATFQGEIARLRTTEEAVRRDTMWRSEEKVAQRDAEITVLQNQVAERRQDVTERCAAFDCATIDFATQRSELVAQLRSTETELQSSEAMAAKLRADLTALGGRHDDAEAALAKAAKDLERAALERRHADERAERARGEVAVAEDLASAAEESAAAAWARLAERPPPRPPPVGVAEQGVSTSPRLLPAFMPLPEGQRWGNEIAALHRSVAALQAMTALGTGLQVASEGVQAPSEGDLHPLRDSDIGALDDRRHSGLVSRLASKSSAVLPQSGAVAAAGASQSAPSSCSGEKQQQVNDASLAYVERCAVWFRARALLWDAWETWVAAVRSATTSARLDMAMADEQLLAAECRLREEGIGLTDALARHFPEPTPIALRRLVLEFRHRVAAALAEFMPAGEPPECRAMVQDVLVNARLSLGRLLHAACFLYQKLRTLVPSELMEPLQDPLTQLVPMPFYVLPYKARQALHRGLAAGRRSMGGGVRQHSSEGRLSRPGVPSRASRGDASWLEERVAELEERLPLTGGNSFEVPCFIARILQVRTQASAVLGKATPASAACRAASTGPGEVPPRDEEKDASPESRLRDRVDVLLVDALTIFMSGWRSGTSSDTPSAHRIPSPAAVRNRGSLSILAQPAVGASAPQRELCLGRPANAHLVPSGPVKQSLAGRRAST